jgi:hypothetical protein
MIPMLPVLMQATKTARTTMAEWFDRYPPGYPWTVASDYCIGDVNKPNDVFSFVIIAPHDTAENICRYIAGAAPKDLKNTKDIPLGLVQYLTCEVPVTFSISFVLKREEALLRAHLDVENMLEFVPGAIAYLEYRLREYPAERTVEFHEETVKRFKAFGRELESKNLNAKLARQMHLAAAASATVFNSLNLARQPKAIRWISDRDALIARHDAVVYDLTYVYYMLQAEMHAMRELEAGRTVPTTQANLGFEIPEQTGKHRYDEIVRLPDYLAGTLADLNSETMTMSHDKFDVVLNNVFVNSKTNWVVQLLSSEDRVTARSALFCGRGWRGQ